jgi:hypothetical protein
MAVAPIYVPITQAPPAKYNLLDTVPPQPLGERFKEAAFGGVQALSDFCGTARIHDAICDETPTPKVADDGIGTVTGDPIPIYHIFQCRLVGGTEEEYNARAVRSLDLGASRAVEEGFQIVFGTGATDVTPAAPVDPVKSLGILEQYAGTVYGGRPVIHMNRLMATRLYEDGAIERNDGHLETGLGSLVIAGAGYDADAALPSAVGAGTDWMYATGEVRIWEGKTVVSGVVLEETYDNEFKSLAERVYVPTFECFKAAIKVTE